MPAPVIGIDWGTTYARVAVVQHGKVKVITNQHGNRSTPSCVAFTDREPLIGEEAVSQATHNPENTIFSAKRMIGRTSKTDEILIEQELGRRPPKFRYDGNYPNFSVKDCGEPKLVPPAAISAMVLARMKQTAEAFLGETVTDAVITVPANFYMVQRQATQAAGSIAGLEVRRIINEPTAAALAYGLGSKLDREQTVLVFDLGGGTLDVSILTVADGVYQVLSTAGNNCLGGDDFDHRLVQYFSGVFRLKHGMDLSDSPQALCKLRMACEEAKRTLSCRSVAYIKIESLYEGVSFSSEISRDRFNELCDDLFQDTLGYVQKALEDTKLERSSIEEVILVGGSTRIPKIRQLLQDLFDGKRLNRDVDADEAVVCGAAAHAALLSGDTSLGTDGHVLVDVVPFSWGVAHDEAFFKTLIERNSRVPIRRHMTVNMIEDYQAVVEIGIYEGQHILVDNNSFCFKVVVINSELAPQSEARVVVVFDADIEGILRVGVGKTIAGASARFTCYHWRDQKGLWLVQTDTTQVKAETEVASVEELTGCREDRKSEDDEPGGREREQKGVRRLDVSDDGKDDEETEEGRMTAVVSAERAKYDGCDNKTVESLAAEGNALDEDKGEGHQEAGQVDDEGRLYLRVRDEKDGSGCPNDAPSKEVCAVGPSNLRDQPPSDGQLRQRRHDEEPPAEEVVDDILFVVQALLDAEPRTSTTERLEIYYRCAAILEQIDTTSRNLHVTHRCSELLLLLLRQLYGDAASSYKDDTVVPVLEMPSLHECMIDNTRDVLQATMNASDAGAISHDDTSKVNANANWKVKVNANATGVIELIFRRVGNGLAGAYELLRRIKEVQNTCKTTDGLEIPSDDFKKRTNLGNEGHDETEETASEDDEDDDTESKDSHDDKDDETKQNSNDLPPLEEVF